MHPLFLQGHSRPLTWVQINNDGDLIFTCGKDSNLSLWRTSDGQRIGTYSVGTGVVWACDCTLDSQRVIAASAEQKLMVFDVCSGELLCTVQEQGPCKFVEWNRKPTEQNKFVVCHEHFGSHPKAIKVYRLEGDQAKRLWSQDDFPSRCIQVHWGVFDETIISVHMGGEIMVWDAQDGSCLHEFRAHSGPITCMNLSKDRLLALTCCNDGVAKLWDTKEWRCLKTYKTDRPLNACAISPLIDAQGPDRKMHILLGGGQAAEDVTTTANTEGKFEALLYHMVHEEELGSIKGHFGPLHTLCWLPNGRGYVSGGEDGYARLYKFDDDYFNDDKFD